MTHGMNTGRTVFSQVMDVLHRELFQRCVDRFDAEALCRSFSCRDQFLCMAFAQLTLRTSLRATVECLCARPDVLYHMGFRAPICRTTLAEANERRDARVYEHLAAVLMRRTRRLYQHDTLEFLPEATAFALDSTTIELGLALFPWARAGRRRAAIKLHTLLALQGNIPTVVIFTAARVADVNLLDDLTWEAGAFYIFDRGYLDFARLYHLHQCQAFFVTRARKNFCFRRSRSRPVAKADGVLFDQSVRLADFKTKASYPQPLRRIGYCDADTGRKLVFLTNHGTLPAADIARLYKGRWQIELFFRWIKQHLCIQRFFGQSRNAVKTQIWIALCVYLLIAILKKERHLPGSLHTILQIISVHPFEKVALDQLLTKTLPPLPTTSPDNQLEFQYL
jgi:hypothetical protein